MKKCYWFVLVLLVASSVAQQPLPNKPDPAKPAPEMKPALPAAPADAEPDTSQESFVIEQLHNELRFENDGTGYRRTIAKYKVLTDAAVQELGLVLIGYNTANETAEIDYLRVRKPDGSVVTASADNIQDMPAPITREAPMYTDFRQKHIQVPALRPGDTVEYQVTVKTTSPLIPGHFWTEYEFQKEAIVLDERLTVNIPKARELKLKTRAGFEPKVRDENGQRIYTWAHANKARKKEEDDERMRRMMREAEQPPAVQLSTFQTWEQVGEWYAKLQGERVQVTDEVKAKALALTKGVDTDEKKVRAIYDYVAKEIRYVSLSFGVGRYQPHAPNEVLSNQYGDCKDKHTLLAAMLKAVGLKAYPVLIHSRRKLDEGMPSPAQFDHLISAVPVGMEKEYVWLDATAEVAPYGLISSTLRKKQALVMPEGQPGLMKTPGDLPFASSFLFDMDAKLTPLGKLEAQVKQTARGDLELALRQAFRRVPQNRWKELGQALSYSFGFYGETTEVTPGDPAATDQPFTYAYKYGRPNFIKWNEKKAQMDVPLPPMGLPGAPEEDEKDPDPDPEPLELGAKGEMVFRLKMTLPEGYKGRAPLPVTVKRDYAEYRATYKIEGQTLLAERAMKVLALEVPRERMNDYRAFQRAVRADEGQIVALETTGATGAAAIPDNVKPEELHQAAMAALENRDFKTAEMMFKKVTELEPKHKWAWNNLGRVYLNTREYDKAQKAFEQQIAVNPYDEYAYNNLGLLFRTQRKYDKAEEQFRKQLEINPLDKYARQSVGEIYLEQKKYAEAVTELEAASSQQPENPAVLVRLGNAYLNTGADDKALAAYDRAVQIMPNPGMWNNIAYELGTHKAHFDRALQYAESAVSSIATALRNTDVGRLTMADLGNTNLLAASWDTLGWVYFHKGDLANAEKYIHAAWLMSEHGEVGDHLAQVYEKQGRKDDALRMYALAMNGERPLPETRGKLVKLAGGEKQADALAIRHSGDLAKIRNLTFPKQPGTKGTASFLVLVSSGGTDAKFVSGDESLKVYGEALKTAKMPITFPDQRPAKLVRKGVLTCEVQGKECVFVLLRPDEVNSLD